MWNILQGITPYSWEQHSFLDNVFLKFWEEISPNSGNNTGFWIMYLGIYDRESIPTLGNNTGFWIMYLGLYHRESPPNLGNKSRCLDNVFGNI